MNGSRSAGGRLLLQRLLAARAPVQDATRIAAAADGTTALRRTPGGIQPDPVANQPELPDLPDYLIHTLARWRLLQDVGFRNLVPDSRLLPAESIRFFTLDSGWLDALVTGALAAGGQGGRERAQQARIANRAISGAEQHVHLVRDIGRGRLVLNTPRFAAAADAVVPSTGIVTGFILRSAAVAGWPGLQVRAWTSDDPADVPAGVDPAELAAARPDLVVRLLRMELLAPSVLLVLFAGTPALVWLEEPHHGVQLGLEEAAAGGWTVPIRTGTGQDTGAGVTVPMRPGPVPGVVDVTGLRAALDAADPLPGPRGSAAIALALLQAPSRQRFAASTSPSQGRPDPPDAVPARRRRRQREVNGD